MKALTVLNTDGSGLWSDRAAPVEITHLELGYINDEGDFGELQVYFNNSWDVSQHGLIYTDELFYDELLAWLSSLGYHATPETVSYSEQGMQGSDYVSLDIYGDFIKSWDTVKIKRMDLRMAFFNEVAVIVPIDHNEEEVMRVDMVDQDGDAGTVYATGEETGEQYALDVSELDLNEYVFYRLVATTPKELLGVEKI